MTEKVWRFPDTANRVLSEVLNRLLTIDPGFTRNQMVTSVNAFHEKAVYVKRQFAILLLFLRLSFLKPTFLS